MARLVVEQVLFAHEPDRRQLLQRSQGATAKLSTQSPQPRSLKGVCDLDSLQQRVESHQTILITVHGGLPGQAVGAPTNMPAP
jgi:hypothetical protein